jgi:hypothetical protein
MIFSFIYYVMIYCTVVCYNCNFDNNNTITIIMTMIAMSDILSLRNYYCTTLIIVRYDHDNYRNIIWHPPKIESLFFLDVMDYIY